MSRVNNSGFEVDDASWLYSGLAARTAAYGAASGLWAASLETVRGIFDNESEAESISFDLDNGEEHQISIARRKQTATLSDVSLQVWLDAGSGSFVLHASENQSVVPSSFETWSLPAFTATGTSGRVRIVSSTSAQSDGVTRFVVDDVSILSTDEIVMAARRRAIKDAIVTKIGTIATPTHSVDIGDSVDERVRPDRIENFPAAQTVYGRERKSIGKIGPLGRKTNEIFFVIFLHAKDDTADDVLDDLAADVETVLETTESGSFLGLSYVSELAVIDINPIELAEAQHQDRRVWSLVVRAKYHHAIAAP